MIRRDIQLGDGEPQWLLVSQVEHARLSGDLARRCNRVIGAALDTEKALSIRAEVQAAIYHHDDGWYSWDASPGLDPSGGRPLSFRELPLWESMKLWDASISRCGEISPLAAWVVASHFCALLEASTREHDEDLDENWLRVTGERCQEWLQQWQAQDAQFHTRDLAEEALNHLRVFDVMSLWLSLVVPTAGETIDEPPSPYKIGEDTVLQSELRPRSKTVASGWHVHADPWIFDQPTVDLEATGLLVPIRAYRNGEELLAAGEEYRLGWRLSETTQ